VEDVGLEPTDLILDGEFVHFYQRHNGTPAFKHSGNMEWFVQRTVVILIAELVDPGCERSNINFVRLRGAVELSAKEAEELGSVLLEQGRGDHESFSCLSLLNLGLDHAGEDAGVVSVSCIE
jgi:hypothetical protein